jgi:fluoride exporter
MQVSWRELGAVALGGLLGTGARLTIDTLVHQPTSTLAINVAGSFALGLLVARLWSSAAPWLRAGLGAGLLGSFTTFSALAVTVVSLGVTWSAALYLVASVTLGLLAAWAGLRLGSRRAVPIEGGTE